jgi:TolA-binding protein
LQSGRNLEKSGKTAAALGYYRQVIKDFPGTPAAETAADRVKALSPR